MTIEEAIEYWEELRKTFSCQIEKEENHFGRMHLQTTIDVIDTTLSAIRAQKEYTSPCDLCGYNPPSRFDGKPCALCPAVPKEPTEEEQYRMTNADRIRAMRDEEMAELLLDSCRGSKCEDQPKNEWGSVNCFQCRMNWLQQPAEEKKHGV